MDHNTLTRVLTLIRPGSQWLLTGDTYDTLTWLDAVQAKPSQAECDAVDMSPAAEAARVLAADRSTAVTEIQSDPSPSFKLIRAVVLVLVDRVNVLQQRDTDRNAAVQAAASLADLKTRWAAITPFNDVTPVQAKTAVQSKLSAGTAD